MVDYPDFGIYDILRKGNIKIKEDFVVLHTGGFVDEVGTVDGPGFIYALRVYVEGKVGAEDVNVYIKMDGVVVHDGTFKELQQMGAWQPLCGFVYLSQYDVVNGNFSLLIAMPSTFQDVLGVTGSHNIGSDVTLKMTFQYALME